MKSEAAVLHGTRHMESAARTSGVSQQAFNIVGTFAASLSSQAPRQMDASLEFTEHDIQRRRPGRRLCARCSFLMSPTTRSKPAKLR
jgi:hypothetical protein